MCLKHQDVVSSLAVSPFWHAVKTEQQEAGDSHKTVFAPSRGRPEITGGAGPTKHYRLIDTLKPQYHIFDCRKAQAAVAHSDLEIWMVRC